MKVIEARLLKLCEVFATVKTVNTYDWMEYAAGEINAALADIGDLNRVRWCRECESIIIESMQDVVNDLKKRIKQ